MNKKWFEMNEAQLEAEFNTSTINGLSKKGALSSRRKNGANIVFRLPHGSFLSYLKDILSDSASIILILAALIATFFQNTTTSYVIAGIIVLNLFVVVFTYVKAHRILESMGEYSLPGAKVIRDGHLYLVSMNSLVPGDLIYLKAGDIVPADARIITAEGFFVSEKGITGNLTAIRKSPQNVSPDNNSTETMFNMVFATSVVLKGSARAIVVETGNNTLVSRTHKNELDIEHDNLDIFIMLKKFSSQISMLMLIMVFVIMFSEIFVGADSRGIYDIFIGGMSLAVAAMTEFYTAFGYIIVACGLFGARSDKTKVSNCVIMKNINAIEKLRDINCVIFRKDGFISDDTKTVDTMYSSGQIYRTKDYDKADAGFACLIEAAAVSTGIYMKGALSAPSALDRQLTPDEDAIIEWAKKYDLYNISLDTKYPLVMHRNSTDHKISYSVVMPEGVKYDPSADEMHIYLRGNARTILKKCTKYNIGTSEIPLDPSLKKNLLTVISEYEKINTSVLAIAVTKSGKNTVLAENYTVSTENSLTFIGFITIKAPLLEGSPITIDKLKNNNIKLIINSSGSSTEDISAAKSLGLCKSEKEILTERAISLMTDEEISATISSYSVFMDFTNPSMRKAIAALKDNGYKVAYCADSLTDISVLEQADIGYTYADIPQDIKKSIGSKKHIPKKPGNTSDALRFKSDVIIPKRISRKNRDGGIFSVENSILTSKLIYRNLINMFAYLIGVQSARIFIILYSVFTKTTMLTPTQILVGGLLFDFLAVLSIAFSKPSSHTSDEYNAAMYEMTALPKFILRNALFGLFWAAMTIFIPTLLTLFTLPVSNSGLTTTAFISFTLLQILTLAEIKRTSSIFELSSISFNSFYLLNILCTIIFIGSCMIFDGLGLIMNVITTDRNALIAIFLIVVSVVSLHEVYKYILKK